MYLFLCLFILFINIIFFFIIVYYCFCFIGPSPSVLNLSLHWANTLSLLHRPNSHARPNAPAVQQPCSGPRPHARQAYYQALPPHSSCAKHIRPHCTPLTTCTVHPSVMSPHHLHPSHSRHLSPCHHQLLSTPSPDSTHEYANSSLKIDFEHKEKGWTFFFH